jgi:hypothetical protein
MQNRTAHQNPTNSMSFAHKLEHNSAQEADCPICQTTLAKASPQSSASATRTNVTPTLHVSSDGLGENQLFEQMFQARVLSRSSRSLRILAIFRKTLAPMRG